MAEYCVQNRHPYYKMRFRDVIPELRRIIDFISMIAWGRFEQELTNVNREQTNFTQGDNDDAF